MKKLNPGSLARLFTLLLFGLALGLLFFGRPVASSLQVSAFAVMSGLEKVKHVVIIMQENRSFDHYFGSFPGADGIPMKDGTPTVCVPNPATNECVKPFHDSNDLNHGGPHAADAAINDIDGGKMDGFIREEIAGRKKACKDPNDPQCTGNTAMPDVMGYHDAREIPNYWAYAREFVLQDHMFEPDASWSLPAHLFMVSAWSASCDQPTNPMTCHSDLGNPDRDAKNSKTPDYGWTDITYLLHKAHVSWAYYVDGGYQPDCDDGEMTCPPKPQKAGVPEIWNPLVDFVTVHEDGELSNIQDLSNFYDAAKRGTLPAVSWIVPNGKDSEHPVALVSVGQAYVTNLINAIMQGPDWDSTVIFLSWDDWGGFYDHIVPAKIDANGYGIRVPGIVISPYAKRGFIDHQILSWDAYLKFIEDVFLGGQRLDPKNDGRPDPRPTVRETVSQMGDLLQELDFSQSPRPPLILPTNPPPGKAADSTAEPVQNAKSAMPDDDDK
ncbi:alkaline phosphatase family protein [Candidatus Acetothermia bacterium]|nr:alkaline phosphatase family protein [Candidatus Acetothermia bacterium]